MVGETIADEYFVAEKELSSSSGSIVSNSAYSNTQNDDAKATAQISITQRYVYSFSHYVRHTISD